MNLSQKIKEARQSEGLSQKELAVAVGVSPRTVTYWETEDRQPDIVHLVSIARATKKPLEFFVAA